MAYTASSPTAEQASIAMNSTFTSMFRSGFQYQLGAHLGTDPDGLVRTSLPVVAKLRSLRLPFMISTSDAAASRFAGLNHVERPR